MKKLFMLLALVIMAICLLFAQVLITGNVQWYGNSSFGSFPATGWFPETNAPVYITRHYTNSVHELTKITDSDGEYGHYFTSGDLAGVTKITISHVQVFVTPPVMHSQAILEFIAPFTSNISNANFRCGTEHPPIIKGQ